MNIRLHGLTTILSALVVLTAPTAVLAQDNLVTGELITTVNSGTPGKGGEVTFTVTRDITNWNVTSALGNNAVVRTVTLPIVPSAFMVQPDFTLKMNTDLLESAELTSTDPQTVVYRIREDAVWSDGTEIPQATLDAVAGAMQALVGLQTTGGADGRIDWSFALEDRHVDFLAVGETLTLTYRITLGDDSGATNDETTRDVTVTITGTNDAPVIAIPNGETTVVLGGETAVSRSVSETNAALTASGTLTVTDVDNGSIVTTQVVGISGGGSGYDINQALGFLTVAPGSINDAGETDGLVENPHGIDAVAEILEGLEDRLDLPRELEIAGLEHGGDLFLSRREFGEDAAEFRHEHGHELVEEGILRVESEDAAETHGAA